MITGSRITAELVGLGLTHVVWLPDSVLGTWETAIEAAPSLQLVRVCREGEAWTLAAGLWMAGARPLVVMQSTGLFESGDALRNVIYDLKIPLHALIGYRSYLLENSPDSARRFTEPILQAWGLDYLLLTGDDDLPRFAAHYRACQTAARAGITLIAEGRG